MLTLKAVMVWALNTQLITHSLTNSHLIQRIEVQSGTVFCFTGIYFFIFPLKSEFSVRTSCITHLLVGYLNTMERIFLLLCLQSRMLN